ncbi:MAG: hypothetical protein JWM86_1503 [Thermoleophilia bacterium]|nr:hypothetical protein [Thermoleophilia bacterium]
MLLIGGGVAAAAALTACAARRPEDDVTPEDLEAEAVPVPQSPVTPETNSPGKPLPITAGDAQTETVRQALEDVRGTEAGKRVLEAAEQLDVKIQVLGSAEYDARNGAGTLAVARSQWQAYPGKPERLNVQTVVEVDGGSFTDGTRAERASTLAHELQHALDARDEKITSSRSEARAYTVGDQVQTALGERPGREAISRDDRTGDLLSMEQIVQAVCADPTYADGYRASGTWQENCAGVAATP